MSKNRDSEIILIDEDDSFGQRDKYPLPGIAQRIMKKQKLPSGQVKYLVKWQGHSEDDATWETDEAMRARYSELIQDYEFYVLTGERFDDALIQHTQAKRKEQRESSSDSHRKISKRAVKGVGRQLESYEQPDRNISTVEERTHKQVITPATSRNDKQQERIQIQERIQERPQDCLNIQVDRPQERLSKLEKSKKQKIQNKIMEKEKQLLAAEPEVRIDNQEIQKLKQIQQPLKLNASKNDKIESVTLLKLEEDKLFNIQWKAREDGSIPLNEYYSYQMMSLCCPMLIIKFFESLIGGRGVDERGINYICQGDTEEERMKIIRQAIINEVTKQNNVVEVVHETNGKQNHKDHSEQQEQFDIGQQHEQQQDQQKQFDIVVQSEKQDQQQIQEQQQEDQQQDQQQEQQVEQLQDLFDIVVQNEKQIVDSSKSITNLDEIQNDSK